MSYTLVDSDDVGDSHRSDDKRRPSHLLYRVSAILTPILLTVICILLILNYHAVSHKHAELLGGAVQKTRYGSELAYMSLDHRFDDLWDEELHPQNGIIRLQDGSLAAISMYVSYLTALVFLKHKTDKTDKTSLFSTGSIKCTA